MAWSPSVLFAIMSCVVSLAQESLMMTNGCLGSSNVAECQSIKNGLFLKGLHAASQYFLLTITNLMASRVSGSRATLPLSVRQPTPNSCCVFAPACVMLRVFRGSTATHAKHDVA